MVFFLLEQSIVQPQMLISYWLFTADLLTGHCGKSNRVKNKTDSKLYFIAVLR